MQKHALTRSPAAGAVKVVSDFFSIVTPRPTKSLGLILDIMHQLKLKINVDV